MTQEISKQTTTTQIPKNHHLQRPSLQPKPSLQTNKLNPVKLFRLRSPAENNTTLLVKNSQDFKKPINQSNLENCCAGDYDPSFINTNLPDDCDQHISSENKNPNNHHDEKQLIDLASPQIIQLPKAQQPLQQQQQSLNQSKPHVPIMSLRARKNRSMCSHNSIADLNISRSAASTGTSSAQLVGGGPQTLKVSLPSYQTLGLNNSSSTCDNKNNNIERLSVSVTSSATLPVNTSTSQTGIPRTGSGTAAARQVSLKMHRRKTPQVAHESKNSFPKDFFYTLPTGDQSNNDNSVLSAHSGGVGGSQLHTQQTPYASQIQHPHQPSEKQYSWSRASFASNDLQLQRFRSVQQKMLLANQLSRLEISDLSKQVSSKVQNSSSNNINSNETTQQSCVSGQVAPPLLLGQKQHHQSSMHHRQQQISDYSRWIQDSVRIASPQDNTTRSTNNAQVYPVHQNQRFIQRTGQAQNMPSSSAAANNENSCQFPQNLNDYFKSVKPKHRSTHQHQSMDTDCEESESNVVIQETPQFAKQRSRTSQCPQRPHYHHAGRKISNFQANHQTGPLDPSFFVTTIRQVKPL